MNATAALATGHLIADADAVHMTQDIARHVAAVAQRPLDASDQEALRRLLLDNFIVSCWGATRAWTRELAAHQKRFAGCGTSPVLGTDWCSDATVAALVHGTAAHSFELDDTHDETLSHPGAAIIPAALALGAALQATQGTLFQALAAGYEAMALLGSATGGMETVHRGFHPTAIFGAFGAATACVSLDALCRGQRVEASALIAAWGQALSLASGAMQFSAESTGGEIKRVHAGLGARNGVLAAEWARLPALTAPERVLEGRYGLAALFGGPLREVKPVDRLQIHGISFKPYACCRLFHSTIDALRQLSRDFTRPLDDLKQITVLGPALIADQHMLARPQSTMAAQYSCPYIVGATLRYGPERYDAYDTAYLQDPLILGLADKVHFELSESITRTYYPTRFATAVRWQTTQGESEEILVADSLGTPRRPLQMADLLAKGAGLGAGRAEVLAQSLWDPRHGATAWAKTLASTAAGLDRPAATFVRAHSSGTLSA